MDAFQDARTVDERGRAILKPYALHLGADVEEVEDGKSKTQECYGDWRVSFGSSEVFYYEVKTEEKTTGNLFLEEWSNLGYNQGWFCKSRGDVLWYYFLDLDNLWVCPIADLQVWAFTNSNIKSYPSKPQRKRDQNNESWGWCVPTDALLLALKRFRGPFHPRQVLDAEASHSKELR